MPSFNDYLQLLDKSEGIRPQTLARAIRRDKNLADWQRSSLLMQLGFSARRRVARSVVETR